jgi:hypothetical protein
MAPVIFIVINKLVTDNTWELKSIRRNWYIGLSNGSASSKSSSDVSAFAVKAPKKKALMVMLEVMVVLYVIMLL